MKGFTREVLKDIERPAPAKNPECTGEREDFQEPDEELMYILGGPDEPKLQQKKTHREVFLVNPPTPQFLTWSEMPITFDRYNQPGYIPRPG